MNRTSQSFCCGMRSDDAGRPPSPSDSPARLRARSGARLLTLALVAALLPGAASAQRRTPNRESPDFLIGHPHVTLSLRGGMLFPRADSRVYDMAFSQMSLPGDTSRMFKRSDLNAPMIAGEVAIWTPRADITFSLGYARNSRGVEYRYWLDNNDLPIENTARLTQVPLTVGLKAYLLPRGREVGRYAYIPARYQPYVGLAGGTVYHSFRERGDFVNFFTANYAVYSTTFESNGWSPTVELLAGNEFSLTRSMSVQVELRYGWASGHVGEDFPALAPPPVAGVSSHDKIDVSGLQTTIGFGWRL